MSFSKKKIHYSKIVLYMIKTVIKHILQVLDMIYKLPDYKLLEN